MNAKYWQKGETLDYTPTAAVKNGAVVSLGTRIGIAGDDIAANAQGQIHVSGVFEMAKATGAITMGAAVYYDATNDKITTAAGANIPAGYAAAAAASADTTVLVCIGAPDDAATVHTSLALKDSEGAVYDVTVSTAGALTATKRT